MKACENPFRSSAVAELRYRVSAEQLRELVRRAGQPAFRQCCLLGPQGSGKTTLLEDMEAAFRDAGLAPHWIRLHAESTWRQRAAVLARLRERGSAGVCLFDGGEILPWWQWLQLRLIARRRNLRLIATLHRRRGLPVLHRHRTDWVLARGLVRQLAGRHLTPGLESAAQAAFRQSAGNVREVFRACYWVLAKAAEPPQASRMPSSPMVIRRCL